MTFWRMYGERVHGSKIVENHWSIPIWQKTLVATVYNLNFNYWNLWFLPCCWGKEVPLASCYWGAGRKHSSTGEQSHLWHRLLLFPGSPQRGWQTMACLGLCPALPGRPYWPCAHQWWRSLPGNRPLSALEEPVKKVCCKTSCHQTWGNSTTNGPALENIKGQIMPTGSHRPEC